MLETRKLFHPKTLAEAFEGLGGPKLHIQRIAFFCGAVAAVMMLNQGYTTADILAEHGREMDKVDKEGEEWNG